MTQLICGLLRLDGAPPEEALVRRMAEAMICQGLPSAVEVAVSGPVAMAAIRLGSPGAGDAPEPPGLIENDGGVIAADVLVYDRARMGLARPCTGLPDAGFVWAAVAERGGDAFGDLHGDFAIAIWRDGRLTLARDHFGARPLVYTEQPGRYVAFASTPAALVHAGLAEPALDEAVVASWVLDPTPPPGRTHFRDVRTVDAAHLVKWRGGERDGSRSGRRYWRLDTRRRLPFGSDPRELAAETRRLLIQSVTRRLPRSGPGAGHLSGGLDSSPIAVLAARALAAEGRQFFGYTLSEPDEGPGLPGAGDAPVADRVAAAEPAITQIPVIAPGVAATYEDGVDPCLLLPLSPRESEEQILRHAAGQGARVMFCGWGGDQIVSYQGRGAELEVMRAGRFLRLGRALKGEAEASGIGIGRLFISLAVLQALPQRLREAIRRKAGSEHGFHVVAEQRSRLIARHRRDDLLDDVWPDEGDTHEIRRRMAEAWYIQTRLEAYARQGARHGIAYCFPLLDLDLVEFSIQVPGIFLRSKGRRRVMYREALAGILPDDVRLHPVKPAPFPGEDYRTAATRERLLALCQEWRNNARVCDYLDLDFMAHRIRTAADPDASEDLSAVSLAYAFDVAYLLLALDRQQNGEAGE